MVTKATPDAEAQKDATSSSTMRMNAKKVAQLLDVSYATVVKWIDEEGAPCITRGSRGKGFDIDAPSFVAWWGERVRRSAADGASSEKLSMRRETAEVAMLELKLSKERGDVVLRIAVVHFMTDMFARLSVAIDQMPEQDAEGVIGLRDRTSAIDALTLIGDQLRTDLRAPDMWLPSETAQLELSA